MDGNTLMIFIWVLIGIVVLMGLVALVNWWRDEQERWRPINGFLSNSSPSPYPATGSVTHALSPTTPLHPSIDPYLVQLREYLLTPPLPQSPGEMAERVYTHLNQWVNTRLTADASNTVDLEGELLIEPTQRFVNMSRNDPVPPPGYLENLMKEEQ
jgi:hypothetical protein